MKATDKETNSPRSGADRHFLLGEGIQAYEQIWGEAYKAGIREVVEWIEKNSYMGTVYPDDTGEMLRDLLETDWQTKLKEWQVDKDNK